MTVLKHSRTLALAAGTLLLCAAGCSLPQRPAYSLTPPDDPAGRECAAQCVGRRDWCVEVRGREYNHCLDSAAISQSICRSWFQGQNIELPWYACPLANCTDERPECDGPFIPCYQGYGGAVVRAP